MSSKIVVSAVYLMLIAIAVLNPAAQWSQWIYLGLLLLLLTHFVEFFIKRKVMQAAGGSMLEHFIQTLLFGFFHWLPLERKLAA